MTGVSWVNAQLAAAIWNSSVANVTDLAVLLAIATFADRKTQEARPAIPTLAARARVDKKTVPIALDRLERQGLLSVERHRNRASTLRILLATSSRADDGRREVIEGAEWMSR